MGCTSFSHPWSIDTISPHSGWPCQITQFLASFSPSFYAKRLYTVAVIRSAPSPSHAFALVYMCRHTCWPPIKWCTIDGLVTSDCGHGWLHSCRGGVVVLFAHETYPAHFAKKPSSLPQCLEMHQWWCNFWPILELICCIETHYIMFHRATFMSVMHDFQFALILLWALHSLYFFLVFCICCVCRWFGTPMD